MSKTLFRSVHQLRLLFPSSSSPKFAAAAAAAATRALNTSTPVIEPTTHHHHHHHLDQPHIKNAPNPTDNQVRPLAFKKSHPAAPPAPIQDSVRQLLPLLLAQPAHYITVHIHGFPYLVQEGDQVRLPFRMPGVLPGDVLRLNRASVIGSRDYTLKGAPHVDERLFECRATVLGVESEPLRIKIKTKRRSRRKRQAKSKHRYTILRISEVHVKDLDEIDASSS